MLLRIDMNHIANYVYQPFYTVPAGKQLIIHGYTTTSERLSDGYVAPIGHYASIRSGTNIICMHFDITQGFRSGMASVFDENEILEFSNSALSTSATKYSSHFSCELINKV